MNRTCISKMTWDSPYIYPENSCLIVILKTKIDLKFRGRYRGISVFKFWHENCYDMIRICASMKQAVIHSKKWNWIESNWIVHELIMTFFNNLKNIFIIFSGKTNLKKFQIGRRNPPMVYTMAYTMVYIV